MFKKKAKNKFLKIAGFTFFAALLAFLVFASPEPEPEQVRIELNLKELGAKQYE